MQAARRETACVGKNRSKIAFEGLTQPSLELQPVIPGLRHAAIFIKVLRSFAELHYDV